MAKSYRKIRSLVTGKKRLLEIIEKDFELNTNNNDSKLLVSDINYIFSKLCIIKETESINFVYGKGKRKSKLQKYIKQLKEFIERCL